MKALYCSATDKGVTRDHNEDFFLNNPRYSILMVADGMGGYERGDQASQLGLNSIVSYLDSCTNQNGTFSDRTFKYAIEYANTCIYNFKIKHPEIKNMGTTFVCFAHSENGGKAYNIGDSRVYRFRQNKLEQLTKDHSAEKEVLPDFMQNANEGKYSSVLTRALGTDEKVAADSVDFNFVSDDIFLLCSDGLYSMVPDTEISKILSGNGSLKERCDALIAKANSNGGEDNITATLILIQNTDDPKHFEMAVSE